MRFFGLLSAIVAGLVALTPAQVAAYRSPGAVAAVALGERGLIDRWDDRGRYGRGGYDRRYDRRYYRRDRRWRGRTRWRTECHRQWRGGRPERVCRRIRYRR